MHVLDSRSVSLDVILSILASEFPSANGGYQPLQAARERMLRISVESCSTSSQRTSKLSVSDSLLFAPHSTPTLFMPAAFAACPSEGESPM
mmetsp:Transcript_24445/g.58862  ORF Transcript_24445/g.58862 Transcript_24445/m.58862 type:complete len:91 (-) Transcript_24445:602-874(-)